MVCRHTSIFAEFQQLAEDLIEGFLQTRGVSSKEFYRLCRQVGSEHSLATKEREAHRDVCVCIVVSGARGSREGWATQLACILHPGAVHCAALSSCHRREMLTMSALRLLLHTQLLMSCTEFEQFAVMMRRASKASEDARMGLLESGNNLACVGSAVSSLPPSHTHTQTHALLYPSAEKMYAFLSDTSNCPDVRSTTSASTCTHTPLCD